MSRFLYARRLTLCDGCSLEGTDPQAACPPRHPFERPSKLVSDYQFLGPAVTTLIALRLDEVLWA